MRPWSCSKVGHQWGNICPRSLDGLYPECVLSFDSHTDFKEVPLLDPLRPSSGKVLWTTLPWSARPEAPLHCLLEEEDCCSSCNRPDSLLQGVLHEEVGMFSAEGHMCHIRDGHFISCKLSGNNSYSCII
jgi:hypothetical protein